MVLSGEEFVDGTGARGHCVAASVPNFLDEMIQRLWLIPDSPPTNPGCFMIPSYALKDRSLPTRPTQAEIELAFVWWKKFPEAMLIMSTGDNQRLGVNNAKVMADYAVSLGL